MSEDKPVHVGRNLPEDKYPELIHPGEMSRSIGGDYADEETNHLMDYWRVIVVRRWTIFAIVATSVVVTLIYSFKKMPVYQATASIQIDRENPNILSFKDVYQIEAATDDTLRT